MSQRSPFRVSSVSDDVYGSIIERFFVREFVTNVHVTGTRLLDLLTDAIVATGLVRFGPMPSPEKLVAMRAAIQHWTERDLPIPFLFPWGSEKPVGVGNVDVAELCALKQIQSLNDRVRRHYPPGIHGRVRLEDASAPHLFYERQEAARCEASVYTQSFVRLVTCMGMDSYLTPVPESTLMTEEQFNAKADEMLEVVEPVVLEPGEPSYLARLQAQGWKGELPREQVDFYLRRYSKLYAAETHRQHLHRVARYFAGSLAKKHLKVTGAAPEWEAKYLEIYFIPNAPGIPLDYFPRRIIYRTIPSNITSQHMAPWRCKGYLRICQDKVTASLACSREDKPYNPFQINLEKDGVSQSVQADYVVL